MVRARRQPEFCAGDAPGGGPGLDARTHVAARLQFAATHHQVRRAIDGVRRAPPQRRADAGPAGEQIGARLQRLQDEQPSQGMSEQGQAGAIDRDRAGRLGQNSLVQKPAERVCAAAGARAVDLGAGKGREIQRRCCQSNDNLSPVNGLVAE